MKTPITRTDQRSNKLTVRRAQRTNNSIYAWAAFGAQVAEAHKQFFRKRKIDPPVARLAGMNFGKNQPKTNDHE